MTAACEIWAFSAVGFEATLMVLTLIVSVLVEICETTLIRRGEGTTRTVAEDLGGRKGGS